jgi:ABC-2 type transport system ATP-binding protein
MARVDEVLDVVSLSGEAKRRVGDYSLGMRQRLDLATALLAEPQLLVLDEPANGLDPAGILWLRNLLRFFAATGGSVFVSSHQLAELSLLADEIVVINHGRLLTHTSVGQLTSAGPIRVRTAQVDDLTSALKEAGASVQPVSDDRIEVRDIPIEQVGSIAAGVGAVLYELTPSANTLEEAFLELTNSIGEKT